MIHRRALTWLAVLPTLVSCLVASTEAQTKSIHLRNETIVTPPRAVLPAAGTPQANEARVSGLYLIQLEGPMQPAWRARLGGLGATLLHYVPQDAFVAQLENVSLTQVRALDFVRWVGPCLPEHKIYKTVRERARRKPAENLFLSVLLSPQVTTNQAAETRRNFHRVESDSRTRFGSVLRGTVPPGRLQQLAESPAVLWIEPGPNIKLNDEIASKIVAGDAGPHHTLTQQLGYDGEGVTVAVADSGLDTGEADTMHPDVFGRVTALMFYGELTSAADEHSHGTHVAGIIAGNGATGEVDESDALYGLGVAPGANLVVQRIFDGAGNYEAPPTYETLTRDAVRAGADIGSNSWGDDTQGRYDISAMEFDALVRDADALALGDQPYILEFSAGNAGPAGQTIDSPAVAKNVIATGASQNNRFNLPLEEFPIYDTGQETMADFSSRGPCEDGRIKPDVVAPGTWIASLRSQYANDDFAWWPISDNYMYQGGTSQAGPHASGAAAVFVQYWRQIHTNQTPSPALVKAALINSAVDLDDSFDTGPVPNMDEGWGRVDLTQIVGSLHKQDFVDQTELLSTGQTAERRVLLEDSDEPLKITLAYTDVPGFPAALPALVNDLDLEVIGPFGTLYRGNQFEAGESVPNAPAPDSINNVEAVHLFAPLPGEYIVRVRARNVVQDARQETDAVDQDFALVISGALVKPGAGVVAFDRRVYTAPALIQVKLFDQDLAGQATATLLLRSTTEAAGETITLRASGSTGIFTANVATATGPAMPDGHLQISHGDTIEALYQEASPPGTRRSGARADLVPPVISNVSATSEFGPTILRWTTDEDANGIVLYGTNTLNLSATNRFFDTDHELTLPGIVPNVTYHFVVIAEDLAGNRSTNNGGAFTVMQTPPVLIVDAYNNDLFAVPPLTGYTAPLDQLGVSYDVWNTESQGPVPVNLLPPYRCVIWRVAEFSIGATWSTGDTQAVTNYLAGGGSLLIASMEFLSRLQDDGFADFINDVLQVQSFVADTGVSHISGAPGEAIGSGLDLGLDYTEYEDEIKDLVGIPADASDTITATTNASLILLNGSTGVGVRSPRTGHDLPGRVVYLSFPLDAVPMGSDAGNNRAGLLRNILNFLAPPRGNSTLALDSDVYTVPALATIEVEDLDLAGHGPATARCYSPQQTSGVEITLSETARHGLFRGTILLGPTNQPPPRPELFVRPGDTFRVEYFDASANQTLQTTATIEITPPQISNVSFEPGYVDAAVSWDTSEPADALVQFSESPGSFPINFTAYDANYDLSHELILEHLKPSTTYYFRVVSRDRAGNVTIDDNHHQLYSFTTLTPFYSPWTDNLEHGSNDWTVINAEESELAWTLGVPNNGVMAYSPVSAWGTSLNGASASVAESVLISPGIYLTSGDSITLRFMQNYSLAPPDDPDAVEYGEIDLYTNAAAAPIILGTVSGSSSGWKEAHFDLTPYRGQLIYVGWHYLLFSLDSAQRFGWLLDDISVTASNIVPGTIRITNNLWQARYVLAGPRSRLGQGLSFVMSNAPPGQYRITFGDVPFYSTPPPQTNTLDSLATVVFQGNYTFVDSNHNGMADAWEQQYFGSVSPNRTHLTDTDGDGFTDYAEFMAGTNPTQPNSALRLAPPVSQPDGTMRLAWPSVPGRAYLVEGSGNGRNWIPMSGWILATGRLTTFAPPPGTGAPYLFRLQVRP